MIKINRPLKLATRKSDLALWQANFIKAKLLAQYPDLSIELVLFTTQGDKNTSVALQDIGGKSLFTKELQNALLEKKADFAVHSIKDMSVHETPGLLLAAIPTREDPRDAFLSNRFYRVEDLPQGAVVGTASPRRAAQLLEQRPDLKMKLLRGNVPTRVQKLEQGEFDAIILAAAGLKRLGLEHHIKTFLDPKFFTPAIGQGALGIECRSDDLELQKILSCLNDVNTERCVKAERAVNRVLGGDCHTPIGAYATLQGDQLFLQAFLEKNGKILRHSAQGTVSDFEKIGESVGKFLLAN